MPNTYPGDYEALAAGSEAWADTQTVYDTSAFDGQSSGAGLKEMTLKELMGGAWAQTYDAAGTQSITTSAAKVIGGANWDGSYGPTAYNVTITATTLDGLTPTISGLYEVTIEGEAQVGAEGSATFTLRAAGVAVAGFAASVQTSATAAEAEIYQGFSVSGLAALTAGVLYDIFVVGSGSLTMDYRNLRFRIRRLGPSA